MAAQQKFFASRKGLIMVLRNFLQTNLLRSMFYQMDFDWFGAQPRTSLNGIKRLHACSPSQFMLTICRLRLGTKQNGKH